MSAFILVLFFITLGALAVFSYGYIDPNLTLTSQRLFVTLQAPLKQMAYYQRPIATTIFFILLALLFICYLYVLIYEQKIFSSFKKLIVVLAAASVILVVSYPALTYDLFNYIITAKVTYLYHENPYLVMPVEIPNEPNLVFTRAANKVALYGPVWLAISAIPHILGGENIWRTIVAFKLVNAAVYLGFCYFIWRVTKKLSNVLFFAFNPLILIEVIMNGHNDLYMMFLALGALVLWQADNLKSKIGAAILLFASWWVKGATLVLAPLPFFKNVAFDRMLVYAYAFLTAVFFIVAPIREELYPWYAVWLVSTASLMTLKSHRFIYWFTIVLSFALELRNLPYMWMGYYEGPGPILRTLLTFIPLTIFLVVYFIKYPKKFHT